MRAGDGAPVTPGREKHDARADRAYLHAGPSGRDIS
jgi:hypothetical protein